MTKKSDSKTEIRDYADDLRKSAQAKRDAFDRQNGNPPGTGSGPAMAVPVEDEVDPAELGLQMFDATKSGDIVEWQPSQRIALMDEGYTMVERFITIPPGKGVRAYWLGWSGMLLPDIKDPSKLRYLRKMHLELKSGARVSHIEAAQLEQLFSLPCDGTCAVTIYRGGESEGKNGRRVGQWESWVKTGARAPQHEPDKGYAQVAGNARLHAHLDRLTAQELSRIENAPSGLIAPYLERAKRRDIDAAIAERDAQRARE